MHLIDLCSFVSSTAAQYVIMQKKVSLGCDWAIHLRCKKNAWLLKSKLKSKLPFNVCKSNISFLVQEMTLCCLTVSLPCTFDLLQHEPQYTSCVCCAAYKPQPHITLFLFAACTFSCSTFIPLKNVHALSLKE